MKISIEQLAEWVNGTIEGNAKAELHTIAKIEEGGEGSLCFLSNEKYEKHLYTSQATAVLVQQDFEAKEAVQPALIRVEDPYSAFTLVLKQYEKMTQFVPKGVHQNAVIDEKASVAKDVFVGAFVYIEAGAILEEGVQIYPQSYIGRGVKIGRNTIVQAGVRIYHACEIGENCIIHAGTVIGSDGFGFAPQADGSFQKIPQLGNVVLENNVEIGANCTIDRATMGSTLIKKGAKLDNLIQVAHNVEIGENTVIAAQTGISGSTKIGGNCMVGGQAGFAGHLEIADGSKINAQSGIGKSVKEANQSWSGTPLRPFREHYKSLANLQRIPKLMERIKELERWVKSGK